MIHDGGNPRLAEAWAVRAGQPFDSPDQRASGGVDDKCVVGISKDRSELESNSEDSALDYHYGNAFYMAEINPSGNVFVVEERPKKSTLARLYSPGGDLLKTRELVVPCQSTGPTPAAGNDQSAAEGNEKVAVQTLLISTYKEGIYALVVQGGYVIIVDAELLTITNSFKVVGYYGDRALTKQ